MTQKKFSVTIGSVILTIAAFLISNANKKWNATLSAYFRTSFTSPFITLFKGQTGGAHMHLTTTIVGFNQAFIKTKIMRSRATLFATKGTSTRLYYKP